MTELHAMLMSQARAVPDAPALLTASGAVTIFGVLADHIAVLAEWLNASRVTSRNVVAFAMANGPAAIEFMIAISAVAVGAPLPTRQTTAERRAELARLRPSLLLTCDETGEDGAIAAEFGIPYAGIPLDTEGALPTCPPAVPLPAVHGSECPALASAALLLPTSGTTGTSKLVPLSGASLRHAAALVAKTLALGPEDRVLNVLPLHHTHGLVGAVLSTLTVGGSAICLPTFTDLGLIEALTQLRPTWFTAVPAIHARLAALVESGHVPHHQLRFVRSASAHLPTELARRLNDLLGVPVLQAYALTEAPGQVTGTTLEAPSHDSVGRAFGCEIAILDDAGHLATAGRGEIAVRGPHVARGYLEFADAELSPLPGGWLRTGDLGWIDTRGELHLAGRLNEMINRAGEKVLPEEIEDILTNHPGVRDVVVVGVPDPVLGEAVVALIASELDSVDEVREHARRSLSGGHIPDHFLITDVIPRSASGKVRRRELATELARRLGKAACPASRAANHDTPDPLAEMARVWAEVLGVSNPDPDTHFLDLGGSSLQSARIEALAAERFATRLPPAVTLMQTPTIRAMSALVESLTKGQQPRESATVMSTSRDERLRSDA